MAKTNPTIYETVCKILEENVSAMTLDEIVEAFKEINSKHDKYNYKANIRKAIDYKSGIIETGINVYSLSRWLFDGRRFRVRPDQEAITGGLSAYHIPELKPLIMGLQRKGYDKFTLVFDPQRKQYYELSLAFISDFTNPLRLKGLEGWYLDVGFKPVDEFILSCIDFETDRFNIEHCPTEARDEEAINKLNKTVADVAHELIVRKDVVQRYGKAQGVLLSDVFYSILASPKCEDLYKQQIPPDSLAEALLQDDRFVVKERAHVFLKTDHDKLYPNDDFESLDAQLARELAEDMELDWLADDDDPGEDFEDLEEAFGEVEDEEVEEIEAMIDFAAHVALAENPTHIIQVLLEGKALSSKEEAKDVADFVMQIWNTAPRPELGFRTPNEMAAIATEGSRTISVDFANRKRVGRNDPCPCGSGRKYKKCCLAQHEETARQVAQDTDFIDDNDDIEQAVFNLSVIDRTLDLMDEEELDDIDLDACRPQYRLLIAQHYCELGDIDQAIAILKQLAESEEADPSLNYSFVYSELALCYAEDEDWAEAISWIDKAIAYDAEHEEGDRQDELKLLKAEFRQASGDETWARETSKGAKQKKGDAEPVDEDMLTKTRWSLEKSLSGIGGTETTTSLERAQEVMYEAWESSGRKRVQLAQKAIMISPDCADAYVLLAEEMAGSLREAKKLFEQGVRAGERALGAKAFKEDVGYFWGLIETRPYMRARFGLAQCLWYLGEHTQAIRHYRDMLRLNPNDNQGIRHVLANCLLEDGLDDDLGKLLEQYKDDPTANWLYNHALWTFRREGDSKNAGKSLNEALKQNPFVPPYLLGKKRLPEYSPDYIGFGDDREAVAYAIEAIKAWRDTKGALGWLRTVSGRQ